MKTALGQHLSNGATPALGHMGPSGKRAADDCFVAILFRPISIVNLMIARLLLSTILLSVVAVYHVGAILSQPRQEAHVLEAAISCNPFDEYLPLPH